MLEFTDLGYSIFEERVKSERRIFRHLTEPFPGIDGAIDEGGLLEYRAAVRLLIFLLRNFCQLPRRNASSILPIQGVEQITTCELRHGNRI